MSHLTELWKVRYFSRSSGSEPRGRWTSRKLCFIDLAGRSCWDVTNMEDSDARSAMACLWSLHRECWVIAFRLTLRSDSSVNVIRIYFLLLFVNLFKFSKCLFWGSVLCLQTLLTMQSLSKASNCSPDFFVKLWHVKLRCLQTSSSWKLLRFLWACSSLKNNRTSQFCYATVLLSETVFYIISVRSCNAAVTSLKTRLNRCRHWTSTKTKAVCIRINAVRWYKMTARLKGRRDRRNFCVKAAVTKH